MNTNSLIKKDFMLMVIGQIISIFGNNILRFALPLYLLSETGSAALFGIVSALSFLPMILLSPIGGLIADRVNKRNVMVILDFSTAALVLVFAVLLGRVSLIPLMIVVLMVLYGIQGCYQPSVQASIPVLVHETKLVRANAVVNTVSALAGLIGPVLGGMLYGWQGLMPILRISIVCFLFSAIMEIFIHIPFVKKQETQGVLEIAKKDLGESLQFIVRENKAVGKGILIVAAFNLFFSCMLMVGLPVIITQYLELPRDTVNQLYGYAQGALALGGLVGGVAAGVFAGKLKVEAVHRLLLAAAVCVLPMAACIGAHTPAAVSYFVITVASAAAMAVASIFSIQMLAFVQGTTPADMIGKVISVVLAVSMCAQPIGQAMYGVLFEAFSSMPHILLFFGMIVSILIAGFSKRIFSRLGEDRSIE